MARGVLARLQARARELAGEPPAGHGPLPRKPSEQAISPPSANDGREAGTPAIRPALDFRGRPVDLTAAQASHPLASGRIPDPLGTLRKGNERWTAPTRGLRAAPARQAAIRPVSTGQPEARSVTPGDDRSSTAPAAKRPAGTATSPRRRGRLITASAVALVTAVAFGGALWWLWRFVDGPVEARPAVSFRQARATATPVPSRAGHLQSLYASFDYPPALELVARVDTDHNALEQYTVTSAVDYRQQLTMSVRPLESGYFDDDSSYRYRSMNPELYSLKPESINGARGYLATKPDGQEQTLFLSLGGRPLTLSATSNSPKASAADIMKVVAPSVRMSK